MRTIVKAKLISKKNIKKVTLPYFLIFFLYTIGCERVEQNNNFDVDVYNIEMLKDEIGIFQQSINNCFAENNKRYEIEKNVAVKLGSIATFSNDKRGVIDSPIDDKVNNIIKEYLDHKKMYDDFRKYYENHIQKVSVYQTSDSKKQLAALIKLKNAYYLVALHTCTSEIDMDNISVYR